MSLSDIHNLDHTVLLCADLSAMRAFYRDILRLPLETDRERWVSFRVGGSRLSLRARGRSHAGDDGPVPQPARPCN